MNETIRRQVRVPATPSQVWEALVDPDRNEAWMDGRLELPELSPGAPLEFRDGDGSLWEGVVVAVRPGRYLRFLWWRQSEESPEAPSEVSYLLEPDGEGGTRLTVQESAVREVAMRDLTVRDLVTQGITGLRWTPGDDERFTLWAHRFGSALARA